MKQSRTALLSVIMLMLSIGLAGCSAEQEELQLSEKKEKQVSERLAPEGQVALESEVGAMNTAAAGASSGPRSGEEIYQSKCVACHSTGAAGAPKLGVAADWESRVAQGMETLYTNAIQGIRGMPAKGLCMDCSDDEVKAAVDYILAQN